MGHGSHLRLKNQRTVGKSWKVDERERTYDGLLLDLSSSRRGRLCYEGGLRVNERLRSNDGGGLSVLDNLCLRDQVA